MAIETVRRWLGFGAGAAPDSASARGRERYRRAGLTAIAAFGARGLSLALSLATVPLTLGYLGAERYGMWVTISSMIALLGFTDLGIGNGLLNAVARAIATDAYDQARRAVSSGLLLVAGLATVLASVFLLIGRFVPWANVLAVSSPLAANEASAAVTAWVVCFLLGQPLAVATQVRLARQEGYLVHLSAAAGNLAAVAALLGVIHARLGLPILVLAMAIPPLIATAVNGAVLFGRNAPELRPALRCVELATGVQLVRTGFLFFLLQLSMAAAFTSDTLVVAHIVGPEAVASYGVTSRLFLIPSGVIGIMLMPLWPAYGEAVARGDMAWVRSTLRRSLRIGLSIIVPAAILLVALGDPIINIWVGSAVRPPFLLILGFGIWITLSAVGVAVAMVLNGAGEIRLQAVAAVAMATANLPLSIWLTARIGVPGVIWGTVLTYAVLVLIPMALYLPGVLARIADRSDASTSAAANVAD